MIFSISKWWKRLLQQDSSERTYNLFNSKWFMSISTSLVITLMTLGSVIFVYSKSSECVQFKYSCEQGVDTTFTIEIPTSFVGKSPIYLYSGLDDFYPSYQSLKSGYSSIQLQSVPRSLSNLPYSGCSPLSSLSDLSDDVVDMFFPVSVFASTSDWQSNFNLTHLLDTTLRPCGSLFYWIPTDTFSLVDGSNVQVGIDTGELSWDQLDMPSDPGPFPYIDAVSGEFVWADPSSQQMRAWLRANIGPESFVLKQGSIAALNAATYAVTVTHCRDLGTKFLKLCSGSDWIGGVFLSAVYFAFGGAIFIAMIYYINAAL